MTFSDDYSNLYDDNLVSLVVRFIGGRTRELERALASIGRNVHRPIEVIVVYQGIDYDVPRQVAEMARVLPDISFRIEQNATTEDRRAENLNVGVAAARGRYIGFLDDDDTLEPQHINLLVAALQQSGKAWAYAQTTLKKEDESLAVIEESRPFTRRSFSVKALWTENFIPIHSFMLDRTRLVPELRSRPFNERLTRSEDWEFLIRLAFFHEPVVVHEYTCSYYVSTTPRNSNLSLTGQNTQSEAERKNRKMWEVSKVLVDQTKEDLLKRFYWAQDYFAVAMALPSNAVGNSLPASRPSFYNRLVRKAVRLLERTL